MSEFEKYARNHCGISSLKLHDFQSVSASYVSPTIIEERQLNIATMDVFSRLMMDRIIFLGAPIYDDAANIIQAQLLFLESVDPEKDIQIYINSPGGSVSAGLGIYDTMQLVNSDVATICTGLAASMGAVLLTAGAKGKRSALPHSRVMIHQPLGGAQGQASDIEITAREIMKTKRELYEILAAHSGVSVRKIEKDADRDYWLSAREAKNFCREIKHYYGVNPIIYCSTNFYEKYLADTFPEDEYVLWIADYRECPTLRWQLWQHTDSHRIPGIPGKVDRNVFSGSAEEFKKLIL